MRPLFRMRLLQMWNSVLPCSVLASIPRHFLRRVSHFGRAMSFLMQSHLQQMVKAVSTSWASAQSTMCMGASFAACTLASQLRCLCSSRSSSLTLTSPLLAAHTIAPSRRDWMVSQLWLMGIWLKASAMFGPLLILKVELKRGQCTNPIMSSCIQIRHHEHIG